MRAALAGRGILLYFASDPRTLWPLRPPLPVWLDVGVDSIPARWGPVSILGGSRVLAVWGSVQGPPAWEQQIPRGAVGGGQQEAAKALGLRPGDGCPPCLFPQKYFRAQLDELRFCAQSFVRCFTPALARVWTGQGHRQGKPTGALPALRLGRLSSASPPPRFPQSASGSLLALSPAGRPAERDG